MRINNTHVTEIGQSLYLELNDAGSTQKLQIFKGTIPTAPVVGWSGGVAYASDLLITFESYRLTFNETGTNRDIMYVNPTYPLVSTVATQSGTATWFAHHSDNDNDVAFIGTLGLDGAGGHVVEMSTLTIVSGASYLPAKFEYKFDNV